ncbi:hypothetical protein MKQ68_10025 [Chitinophaga horti]|uniref:BIG2 domain-containing protein n=1 Tax=Chitinophaga horti TaxID=2920382 RepID=A0ABY6J6X9_9BACT|nr:hypothetical protein [Chitinophaga horti]UYQ95435.1 hypothetical protein MKQ68_10025 [Chitinophaga horti]
MLIASTCLLPACKKEEDNMIRLSTRDVGVYAGQSAEVEILKGQGAYTATSADESIAKVTVQGNRLVITTNVVGQTKVTVTGTGSQTAVINVHSTILSGTWYRDESDKAKAPEIYVESTNTGFNTGLEAEMQAQLAEPVGKRLFFMFNATNEPKFREIHGDNIYAEGTYAFSNLTLTMKYPNNTEVVYKLEPVAGTPRLMKFTQDATAKYQAAYPERGITKVTIVRYLQMQFNPG